jgi:DNA-binding CsgD family transcriptional regulator
MGVVVFGDVADSRRDSARASSWLRRLTADLDDVYEAERVARFGFTQGDELQGALRSTADPFIAVLRAALDPDGPQMRWAIAAGEIDPGRGPATQRTGTAFLAAREAMGEARRRRESLVVRSGDPATDTTLDDAAPALTALLDELTARQRVVAQLMLVEGLRQADVAARLDVARPTVSVAAERAHVREIGGLARVLRQLLVDGIARAAATDGEAARAAEAAGPRVGPA